MIDDLINAVALNLPILFALAGLLFAAGSMYNHEDDEDENQ